MLTITAPQRPSAQADSLRLEGRTPRTSLLDRIAMRLALALLLWSTRPDGGTDRAAVIAAHRERQARIEREAAWLRLTHHIRPY